MRANSAIGGLCLVLSACATTAPTPPPQRPPGVGPEGAGYEHTLKQSRFNVGPDARREVDGPYVRTVGDRGTFMVDTVTGATLAVPSRASTPIPKGAAAPALPRPLTENPEEHTAAVRAYLVGAGIPAAQVSGTHVTTTMIGGGPVQGGVQAGRSRLLWYSSHLERSIEGVPVEGSVGYAALNANREVIAEGVYWPGIPSEVIKRAVEFKRRMESDNERSTFLGRSRAIAPDIGSSRGEVRIVHTSAGHHGDFEARALYTVVVKSPNGGKARIIRFDESGAVVVMADERPSGSDSPKHE